MPTPSEWAAAYLAQARADLDGARLVEPEPSVFAMILQMAFEKLAKAALLRSGAIDPVGARSTHRAASHMIRAMRLQRGLMNGFGGPLIWQDVLWVIDSLERAHPSLSAGGQQLEYPWERPDGRVGWPARDLTIARSMANPRSNLGSRVLRFASILADQMESIFPD